MDSLYDQSGCFERISHGISPDKPITLKHDCWNTTGPGMRDMHYEVELGIVCKGQMRRELGEDIAWDLSAGMFWMHGIWEPHGAFVTKAPLDLLVIHLNPSMLHGLAYSEGPHVNWLAPFSVPANDRPIGQVVPKAVIDDFSAQLKSLDADEVFYNIHLRFVVLRLLLCIIEHWNDDRAFGRVGDYALSRLQKVLNLVFEQHRLVSVDEAAEICSLSRNGFNKFFSKYMGLRFATFALHHRLSRAAAELLGGDKAIKAIASDWGFTDQSHFYRRFSEVYGCTPVEYRRRSDNK